MPTSITYTQLLETEYGNALVEALDLSEKEKDSIRQGKNLNHLKVCKRQITGYVRKPPDPSRSYIHVIGQVRTAFAKHRVDMVLTLLGLRGCADTIMGDEKIRGVR